VNSTILPYAEVIGDPIAQSKSPAIHGYWIAQLGLEVDYRACHVTAERLADYIAARRVDPHWRGCNITMPHKQAVMPLLDALDPQAAAIGAVNTVIRSSDSTLTGFNTDAGGFLEPLRKDLDRQHYFRMARILGTGGAARAIIRALSDEGFTLVLAGRNPAKAQAMLDELAPDGEHHAIDLAHFADAIDFPFDDRGGCCDLVVNASPLGMRGQPPLVFDWSHAPPGAIVYDIVTDPVGTEFLQQAQAKGHRALDGLNMLIGQAALAFEKFFGVAPLRDDGDAALRKLLTQ